MVVPAPLAGISLPREPVEPGLRVLTADVRHWLTWTCGGERLRHEGFDLAAMTPKAGIAALNRTRAQCLTIQQCGTGVWTI